jgi:hypothetical protein
MPACYAASLAEFLVHDENLIIGRQTAVTQARFTELSAEQLDAWRQQVSVLREALGPYSMREWHLLLEYPIPRRGKRIDAVILAGNVILVLEFKCGARKYERDARIQAEDYCLDLRDFHCGSRHRIVVPVVVATHAEESPRPSEAVMDWVAPVWLANASSLARVVGQAIEQYQSPDTDRIDPQHWNTAEYMPTPTISPRLASGESSGDDDALFETTPHDVELVEIPLFTWTCHCAPTGPKRFPNSWPTCSPWRSLWPNLPWHPARNSRLC